MHFFSSQSTDDDSGDFCLVRDRGEMKRSNKCERGSKIINSTQMLIMAVGGNIYGAILDLKNIQATPSKIQVLVLILRYLSKEGSEMSWVWVINKEGVQLQAAWLSGNSFPLIPIFQQYFFYQRNASASVSISLELITVTTSFISLEFFSHWDFKPHHLCFLKTQHSTGLFSQNTPLCNL